MFRIVKLGTTEKLILAITTSQFSTGAKFTASAITATFYKVNAGGTALEIDTAIGTSGVVTLSVDTGSKTGFHTALLDVSALTAKVYVVVHEATVDGVGAISTEILDIDAERKKIADYLDASVAAVAADIGDPTAEGTTLYARIKTIYERMTTPSSSFGPTTIRAMINQMMNKDGGMTYTQATDSLEASADALAAMPGNLSNQVMDDCTYDSNGLLTAGIIYVYDSAANATTHDKATGLLSTHAVSSTYANKLATLFKSVKTA